MTKAEKKYLLYYEKWDPYYDGGEYIGDFIPYEEEFDTLVELLPRFQELALIDDIPFIYVTDRESKNPEPVLTYYDFPD